MKKKKKNNNKNKEITLKNKSFRNYPYKPKPQTYKKNIKVEEDQDKKNIRKDSRPVLKYKIKNKKKKKIYIKKRNRGASRRSSKYRKFRLYSLYILAVVVILGIGILLCTNFIFNISEIYVSGESYYSAEEIADKSGAYGKNLILLDKTETAENVKSEFPYIQEVSVQKKFPQYLIINVVEYPAVGVIQDGDNYVYINKESKVLEISKELKPDIAQIINSEPVHYEMFQTVEYKNGNMANNLKSIFSAIEKNDLKKISKVDMTLKIDSRLLYDNRITIRLGRISDLDYKLEIGKNILDSNSIGSTEKGTLDLSLSTDQNRSYFKPDYSVA